MSTVSALSPDASSIVHVYEEDITTLALLWDPALVSVEVDIHPHPHHPSLPLKYLPRSPTRISFIYTPGNASQLGRGVLPRVQQIQPPQPLVAKVCSILHSVLPWLDLPHCASLDPTPPWEFALREALVYDPAVVHRDGSVGFPVDAGREMGIRSRGPLQWGLGSLDIMPGSYLATLPSSYAVINATQLPILPKNMTGYDSEGWLVAGFHASITPHKYTVLETAVRRDIQTPPHPSLLQLAKVHTFEGTWCTSNGSALKRNLCGCLPGSAPTGNNFLDALLECRRGRSPPPTFCSSPSPPSSLKVPSTGGGVGVGFHPQITFSLSTLPLRIDLAATLNCSLGVYLEIPPSQFLDLDTLRSKLVPPFTLQTLAPYMDVESPLVAARGQGVFITLPVHPLLYLGDPDAQALAGAKDRGKKGGLPAAAYLFPHTPGVIQPGNKTNFSLHAHLTLPLHLRHANPACDDAKWLGAASAKGAGGWREWVEKSMDNPSLNLTFFSDGSLSVGGGWGCMMASRPPQATFHYSCPVEREGWREILPCSSFDALQLHTPTTVLLTPVATVGDLVWVQSITVAALILLVALPSLALLLAKWTEAPLSPGASQSKQPAEKAVKKRSGSAAAKKSN